MIIVKWLAEQNKIKQLIATTTFASFVAIVVIEFTEKFLNSSFAFDLIDHIATDRQTGGRTGGRSIAATVTAQASNLFI